MTLTIMAMVKSAASLLYTMTILLDFIKAYDLVQRDQVMTIVDEENNVEMAGMVASLLKPSTVTKMGDETKISKVINLRLTQGGPESPALYNKTKNILIRRVLHALKIAEDDGCLAPLKAFLTTSPCSWQAM